MRPVSIHFLEFDDQNIDHLARHGVSPVDVEQMTANVYVTARNARHASNRIYMFGRTDGGRYLTVVLEATYDDVVWRPITAWDSKPVERRLLEGN